MHISIQEGIILGLIFTKCDRGDKGGEIVAVVTPETIAKSRKSYLAKYLKPLLK